MIMPEQPTEERYFRFKVIDLGQGAGFYYLMPPNKPWAKKLSCTIIINEIISIAHKQF